MDYNLNTEQFQGPLDTLLELITAKKLPINEINLAEVTDDFLRHLEKMRAGAEEGETSPEQMRLVADFLVVGSRLVLIKSKSLLPDLSLTEEEEEDIRDLEIRLRLHKRIREAEKIVDELWRAGGVSASRPYFLKMSGAPKVFYPGSNTTSEALRGAIAGVKKDLERFVLASEKIEETIISIEEKMEEVIKRISKAQGTTLRSLSENRSKAEAIIVFLAILHLAREQSVLIEQADRFSDIIITHVDTKH